MSHSAYTPSSRPSLSHSCLSECRKSPTEWSAEEHDQDRGTQLSGAPSPAGKRWCWNRWHWSDPISCKEKHQRFFYWFYFPHKSAVRVQGYSRFGKTKHDDPLRYDIVGVKDRRICEYQADDTARILHERHFYFTYLIDLRAFSLLSSLDSSSKLCWRGIVRRWKKHTNVIRSASLNEKVSSWRDFYCLTIFDFFPANFWWISRNLSLFLWNYGVSNSLIS